MKKISPPSGNQGLLKRFEGQLLISIAFGVLVFLLLAIYAHAGELRNSFARFNFAIIPVVLSLATGNYLTRFVRWQFYLKKLQLQVNRKDSFIVFMSGLTMSVTPGKFGELLKSYLLKKLQDVPVSKSAPIVFAERFTDFTALLLLCLLGVFVFQYGFTIFIASIAIICFFLFLLGTPSVALKFISFAGKLPILKRFSNKFVDMYTNTQVLLKRKELIIGTVIGVFSWSCECIAFYFVILGFGESLPIFDTFFIYSFATIAGAISMLPGGVGATEGSITFLLVSKGIPKAMGVAATFIIRVCTLWFALLVGLFFVTVYKDRFKGIEQYMDPQPENQQNLSGE